MASFRRKLGRKSDFHLRLNWKCADQKTHGWSKKEIIEQRSSNSLYNGLIHHPLCKCKCLIYKTEPPFTAGMREMTSAAKWGNRKWNQKLSVWQSGWLPNQQVQKWDAIWVWRRLTVRARGAFLPHNIIYARIWARFHFASVPRVPDFQFSRLKIFNKY